MGRDRWGLRAPVIVALSAFEAALLLEQRREEIAEIHLSGWKFVEFSDTVRGFGGTCDTETRMWMPPAGATLHHLARRVPYLLKHDKFREAFLLALPSEEEFFILERPDWSTGTLWLEAFPCLSQRPLARPKIGWAT